MLKTLLIILCVYWVIRFFRKMNVPVAPRQDAKQPAQITTELVRDPVCETYIEKTTAVYRNGSYFCSETCAAKFKERAA
jgi:hypothetical protein